MKWKNENILNILFMLVTFFFRTVYIWNSLKNKTKTNQKPMHFESLNAEGLMFKKEKCLVTSTGK